MANTFRSASRMEFEAPGNGTIKQIQLGALQRIADATELMAKSHRQLVDEAEFWKRRAADLEKRVEEARRSQASLRGVITRQREQLKALKGGEVRRG